MWRYCCCCLFFYAKKGKLQQPMVPVQEVGATGRCWSKEVDDFLFRCRRLKMPPTKTICAGIAGWCKQYFTDRLNTGHQQSCDCINTWIKTIDCCCNVQATGSSLWIDLVQPGWNEYGCSTIIAGSRTIAAGSREGVWLLFVDKSIAHASGRMKIVGIATVFQNTYGSSEWNYQWCVWWDIHYSPKLPAGFFSRVTTSFLFSTSRCKSMLSFLLNWIFSRFEIDGFLCFEINCIITEGISFTTESFILDFLFFFNQFLYP